MHEGRKHPRRSAQVQSSSPQAITRQALLRQNMQRTQSASLQAAAAAEPPNPLPDLLGGRAQEPVTLDAATLLWHAEVWDGAQRIHLGSFSTRAEAIEAYKSGLESIHVHAGARSAHQPPAYCLRYTKGRGASSPRKSLHSSHPGARHIADTYTNLMSQGTEACIFQQGLLTWRATKPS
jgi:hypothetical protein